MTFKNANDSIIFSSIEAMEKALASLHNNPNADLVYLDSVYVRDSFENYQQYKNSDDVNQELVDKLGNLLTQFSSEKKRK